MFVKRTLQLLVVLTLSIGIMVSVLPVAAQAESKKAVFCTSAWSGDWLPIYVPKVLLEEKLGFTCDIADLSVAAYWAAIANGDTTLLTISWLPNASDYKAKYADRVEFMGVIYGPAPQSVFVPKWLQEETGIQKISDLQDPKYAKMFYIDKDGVGDYLGCDYQWACFRDNDESLKAYGLDKLYKQMGGNAEFLTATMVGQMKKRQPVLFYQFYPHNMFLDYRQGVDVVMLEDDLKFWPQCTIEKFANKEWIAENPKAAALVRQVEMTADDVMWMMGQVRDKGDDDATLTALAKEWIAKNQTAVDSWLEAIK